MKQTLILSIAVACSAIGLQLTKAWAATGTWNTTTPGAFDWGAATNWQGSIIADGAGNVANFGAVNPTGDITVNLDTPRTVGSLVFGDTQTASGASWIIGGTSALTLDNTGGIGGPAITINSLGFGKTATISAPLNAPAGFTVNGPETLVLSGTHNIAGAVILENGSTLTVANDNSFGPVQFGAAPVAGVGSGSINSLNVNGNLTLSSLTAQTNSSSTINIATGKTLTVNGNLTVGFDTNPSTIAPTSALNMKGGNLVVSGANSILAVGVNVSTGGTAIDTGILDVRGLNSFTFNGGAASEVRVGGGNVNNTGTLAGAALILSNTANTITAGTMTVGGGTEGTAPTGNNVDPRVLLGAGTNVFNVDNFNVSTFKVAGSMSYVSTTGNFVIRDRSGTGRSAVTLGTNELLTMASGGHAGTLNLFAHPVDILASTLTLGKHAFGTTLSSGVLNYDIGTVDTTALVMANNTNPDATPGTANGTITMGGALVSDTATATLKVGTGGFGLATVVAVGAPVTSAVGVLNIRTRGTVQTNSDILISAGTGTINMQGGTLDLLDTNGTTRHSIIVSNTGTLNLNAISGTLKDIMNIDVNGTPGVVNKTLGGRLTIAGTNSYAGDTTINAANINGTVAVTGSTSSAGNVVVTTGTLAGTGSVGKVTLNAGATRIAPGANELGGQFGTLTMTGLSVIGGDLRYDLSTLAGPNDKIVVNTATGGADFAAASTISLGSAPTQAGTYTLVEVTGGGTLTPTSLPTLATAPDARATFTPSFAGNSLVLNVSAPTQAVTWTGAASTVWDAGTAGTQNWSNNGSQTANDKYFNYDAVTFGAGTTDPAKRTVMLDLAVQPSSVTVNNPIGNDYTITSPLGTGDISGSGGLTKSGAGTLFLGTNNTYTGSTAISGGKLVLKGDAAFAGGGIAATNGISISSGASLQVGDGDTTTVPNGHGLGVSLAAAPVIVNNGSVILNTTSGTRAAPVTIFNNIGGTGDIVMNGTGVVRLSGTNNYTGSTTINSGILQLGNVNALGAPQGGPITVASGATFEIASAGNNALFLGTRPLIIAGSGVIDSTTMLGIGAFVMGGAIQQQNAFSNLTLTADASIAAGGRTEIKNGTLNLANNTLTVLSGAFAITNTTITNGNLVVNGTNFTVQDAILQGTGNVTLNTPLFRLAGALPGTMTRPITLSGPTTIGAFANNNPPVNTPTVNIPATVDSPIALQGNLTVSSINISQGFNTITLNGNITQDATPRRLTLIGPMGTNSLTLILSGNNTFSGGVQIDGSVLQLGSPGRLNATTPNPVAFGNGSNAGLRLSGNSVTIGGLLTSTATTPFIENRGTTPITLTVANSTNDTFGGVLRDGAGSAPLALTKAGGGSLILSNTSTYTGATSVNQGTLTLQIADAINGTTKSNLILSGGKFDTGGVQQTMGTLQLADNSGIDLGAAFSTAQFSASNAVAWSAGSTLSVLNWSGSLVTGNGNDRLVFGASASGLTASQVSQIHFQGFNGATMLPSGEVIPVSMSTRLLGDFNNDTHVNAADIPVLITALADVNAYKTANSLTSDDLLNIGDVNSSGTINNADLQALIDRLIAGQGSTAPVPEPATIALMAMGLVGLLGIRRSRRAAARCSIVAGL